MKRFLLLVAIHAALPGFVWSQDTAARPAVHIAVTGESNLKSDFIESLKDAAHEENFSFELVPRSDPSLTFTIIIAQETTIGSAAAAAIALDANGDIAASVVRSGRLSGRGALNACAKEMAKKLRVVAQ